MTDWIMDGAFDALRDVMLIGAGYLYWSFQRDLTASALSEGESWFWILLRFVGVAVFIAGGGASSASGMYCDPQDDCYFEDFTGVDPKVEFYRWMFLALIVGGRGVIDGRNWFNDILNPKGRYAKNL